MPMDRDEDSVHLGFGVLTGKKVMNDGCMTGSAAGSEHDNGPAESDWSERAPPEPPRLPHSNEDRIQAANQEFRGVSDLLSWALEVHLKSYGAHEPLDSAPAHSGSQLGSEAQEPWRPAPSLDTGNMLSHPRRE